MIADADKKLTHYRKEKSAAMKARQIRIDNWSQNEKLYNGQPTLTLLTRSNLHIPKVFEGVQTMSSKIGGMPENDFDVKPEGDENSSELMKAMWEYDLNRYGGKTIWQDSKTEGCIYGRGIYKLTPRNDGAKIGLVDTMAFLIAPTAKRNQDALYCGEQFMYKTLDQIEKDAEEMGYDADAIKGLKDRKDDAETVTTSSQEKSLKDLRLTYLGYANVTDLGAKMVEITEWYTHWDKKKYVMSVANDTYLLRFVELKEVGLPRWPYVSWATYPRGVVFWTPSVADVLRDPNLAMDVTVNQLIDNNTYRNFGMMFVSSSSGLKQSSLVPRPLGITEVNIGTDKSIKDVVWQYTPPPIAEAQATLSTLGNIADAAAGLTATPIGKQGKQNSTQQFSLANASEMKTNLIKQNAVEAWAELGQLYADTLKMNLIEPQKVKVYGNKPATIEGVTKKNFTDVEFIVTAASPENSQENKIIKQKARASFFELVKDDPKVPGQKFLRESLAKEFGYDPTEIDKLFTDEGQPQQGQPMPGQPPQPGAQPGQPQPGQPPQNPPQQIPTAPQAPMASAVQSQVQPNVPQPMR